MGDSQMNRLEAIQGAEKLEGLTFLTEPPSMSRKKKAFSKLESLRKKVSYNLDYDEELASYREKKYGNEND